MNKALFEYCSRKEFFFKKQKNKKSCLKVIVLKIYFENNNFFRNKNTEQLKAVFVLNFCFWYSNTETNFNNGNFLIVSVFKYRKQISVMTTF